jgi:hypothetical protein
MHFEFIDEELFVLARPNRRNACIRACSVNKDWATTLGACSQFQEERKMEKVKESKAGLLSASIRLISMKDLRK